ncbi:MAG: hypothetical protein KGL35_11430 [Bradyrhizobium sp.]|nr:hypothetical protein [Bradyrhizobium sp.]
MSVGFPDFQRITQWLGAPLETQTAYAIGAGSNTWGPFSVSSWQGLLLVSEPTGGNVTFTVRAVRSGGVSGLNVDQSVTVSPGEVSVSAFALYGNAVSLIAQGSVGSSTVSFDLVPTNTIAQSQLIIGPKTMITGQVSSTGTILAGTGFTVNHTGTGQYTITFATPFAAPPIGFATAVSNQAYNLNPGTTATAYLVQFRAPSTGTLTDTAFDFACIAVE